VKITTSLVVIVALMGSAVGLQAIRERQGMQEPPGSASLLYVRSPAAMKRLALSYKSLLADIYWIRAVQHYGGTKLSTDPNKQYDLLYPLLDLTTSLDTRFNVAYQFGAIFLSEPFPNGPGRPDQAIALLQKGLQAEPTKWELAQAIGFVYYWSLSDFSQAASWFQRAAKMPNAPFWMAPLAAVTLAEGGSRESSRLLWQQFAQNPENEWFQREARRRLQQLDAMDVRDRLRGVVAAYRERTGTAPSAWRQMIAAGYLRGMPVDPAGVPYVLANGDVTVAADSPLSPLPKEIAAP
jgi:hypothetical protein